MVSVIRTDYYYYGCYVAQREQRVKGWDCRIKDSKHAWQGEDSLVCGIDASNWAAGQQANYPIYIHSFLHQDILHEEHCWLWVGGD